MPRLVIGKDVRSGLDAFLTERVRRFHTHVIGGTGKGKSKLLELMMRHDLRYKNGFILIDPHGDLFKNMVEFTTRMRYDDRVIIIDPNDLDWSFGLNYLESLRGLKPPVLAEIVARGLAKVFEDENQSAMPTLRRWLRVTLQTLIYNNGTPIEVKPLFDLVDSSLRDKYAEKTKDINLIQEWNYFSESSKSDKINFANPVINRLSVFIDNPIIRAMVSQKKSAIDFREAMDEGKAILCNLSATNNITDESSRLLAVMLIDKVVNAAKSRVDIPEIKRRRFYTYLDEFEDYLCDDIAKGLKGLRKFGISFILAHQEAKPIKELNIKVYSAVMANTDIKIVFSISREDAEIMAKEIFDLSEDIIKDEIVQTKFWPKESRRIIKTRTHTTGGGYSGGSVESISRPEMYIHPSYGTITTATSTGYNDIDTTSDGEVETPFIEYEDFKEVSGRTYYQTDEKLEKYITWIKTQPPRRAYFYIRGVLKKPLAIKTTEVEPIRVREKDVEQLKNNIYTKYALPSVVVKKQLEEKERSLMFLPKFIEDNSEDNFEQENYEQPE